MSYRRGCNAKLVASCHCRRCSGIQYLELSILSSRITYVVAALALPGCTKMPRVCLGVEDVACSFAKGGGPVQPQSGHLRCTWCDPGSLQRCCGSAHGRARLKQLLRNMGPESKLVALQRLPEEPYSEHFEAEFGKQPRPRGTKRPAASASTVAKRPAVAIGPRGPARDSPEEMDVEQDFEDGRFRFCSFSFYVPALPSTAYERTFFFRSGL